MIAAEQWYEFQEQYQKYGVDMQPQETKEHRTRRRRASRPSISVDPTALKDRRLVLLGIAALAVVFIVMIVMTAYAASIRYDISAAEAENNALWNDIKQLQTNQTTMNGVAYIEQRAKEELDMKSAKNDYIVYLTGDDVPPQGFADVLRSKAFQ